MKLLYSFVAIVIACLVMIYILSTQKAQSFAGSDVKRALIELASEYDTGLYKSFYSMDELRPYSIIQLDKIADLYQNEWITPDYIVQQLNEEDKSKMIEKIAEFIDNQKSPEYKKNLLEKIRNWCMDYCQLNFIEEKLGVKDSVLFKALYKINATKDVMVQYKEKKSADEDVFSIDGKNKAYYSAINYISTLQFDSELSYFSEVYSNLALSYKN